MCENASGARASVAASEAARGSHFTQSMVKFATAGLALGAATAAYGRFVELNNFQVREETLAVLPVGSPNFRILHISDMC